MPFQASHPNSEQQTACARVLVFSWLLEALFVNRGHDGRGPQRGQSCCMRGEFVSEKQNTGNIFRCLEMWEERLPPVDCPWYYNTEAKDHREKKKVGYVMF